jgi:hypothetical protein
MTPPPQAFKIVDQQLENWNFHAATDEADPMDL